MDKEDNPNRCACGRKATLETHDKFFWVECTRKDCWHGPVVSRKDKALLAWNKIMNIDWYFPTKAKSLEKKKEKK